MNGTTHPCPAPIEYGLSLGSNLGDRLSHMAEARWRVATLEGVTETAASPVYDTEPVDVGAEYKDQSFLNAVIVVTTELSPDALNDAIHGIEADMGRVRGPDRNAPRPVDIDIIYAGDQVVRSETLTVPHPRWAERRFVVQPLADVRPGLILPGRDESVQDILLALPPTPTVVLYSPDWA